MALELHHQEVMDKDVQCLTCETMNVSDFPQDFKEKFQSKFFYEEVQYIDWPKTILKLRGISYDDFLGKYENFLESNESYYFAPIGTENPLESPELIVVSPDELEYRTQSDPHVVVRRLGYHRKGMRDDFYSKFPPYSVIIDFDILKSIIKLCEDVDDMENFSDNFIDNWTENSFIIIQY